MAVLRWIRSPISGADRPWAISCEHLVLALRETRARLALLAEADLLGEARLDLRAEDRLAARGRPDRRHDLVGLGLLREVRVGARRDGLVDGLRVEEGGEEDDVRRKPLLAQRERARRCRRAPACARRSRRRPASARGSCRAPRARRRPRRRARARAARRSRARSPRGRADGRRRSGRWCGGSLPSCASVPPTYSGRAKLNALPPPASGLDPDPAAVALDDPLADREAHPRAAVLVLAVEALEDLEDALALARVDADAVVAHA